MVHKGQGRKVQKTCENSLKIEYLQCERDLKTLKTNQKIVFCILELVKAI
jgi:hypothetical protein